MLIAIQNVLEPTKEGIRKLPGTVIANASTGEIFHTPPEGEENIRRLLGNLEMFMNETDDDIDPLIKLGVMHYQFESIHPFYDGNGRTGRMLMILYLLLTEKLEYPVLFISEFINQSRSQYYQTLNGTSKSGDYTKIILYMLEAVSQQAQQTEKKILNIKTLMETVEKTMQQKLNVDYHKIATVLFSNPYITITKFAEEMGVVRQTITRYVAQLEGLGIIKTESLGNSTLISIPEFIGLLS
ncbi:MAG: Fic family protein [Candidatus Peribacteria bacterium]|jgi:Fic family protein|nr:Fic family protein [Candidatus Peribacteria bacterium]